MYGSGRYTRDNEYSPLLSEPEGDSDQVEVLDSDDEATSAVFPRTGSSRTASPRARSTSPTSLNQHGQVTPEDERRPPPPSYADSVQWVSSPFAFLPTDSSTTTTAAAPVTEKPTSPRAPTDDAEATAKQADASEQAEDESESSLPPAQTEPAERPERTNYYLGGGALVLLGCVGTALFCAYFSIYMVTMAFPPVGLALLASVAFWKVFAFATMAAVGIIGGTAGVYLYYQHKLEDHNNYVEMQDAGRRQQQHRENFDVSRTTTLQTHPHSSPPAEGVDDDADDDSRDRIAPTA